MPPAAATSSCRRNSGQENRGGDDRFDPEPATHQRRCDGRGRGRHVLQVTREVARGFVAIRRILFEAAVNHQREMRRDVAVHCVDRLRIDVDRRRQSLGRGRARERPLSGDGLVGDGTERELIRSVIGVPSARLFGDM